VSNFSIVIPSRNATNLAACVGAIRAAGETARIIVVDDGVDGDNSGSWDEYLTWVKGVKPFVFSRNVNLGIQVAGDDDVIIMNDDALLETERGFTLMARVLRAYQDVGLIAAACDQVGNPNQFKRSDSLLRPEPRMVCFVCVYIPRRTINIVGLLDERFVGYGLDDDDYSFRVRKAGLKLGIFDGCYVDHGSLPSSYRAPSATNQGQCSFMPNMRRFIEKWGTDNWEKDREHSQFAHLFPDPVLSKDMLKRGYR
jgi:GT2 family glycosyltransferase